MTENDPSGQNAEQARTAGAQPDAEKSAQEAWAAQPSQPQPDATGLGGHATPHTGGQQAYTPEQQYNPWSPQAQQAPAPEPQPQAPYTQGHQVPGQQAPYGQQTHTHPNAAIYSVPQQRQTSGKSGSGKVLAGVAAIALVVGGVAGGTVGFLTSDATGGGSVSALDAPRPAQQTGNAPAGSVESVAQKLSPSVVELQVSGRSGAGEGSGFVLSTDGYVLTNNHVVEVAANGGQIQAVFQDGKKGAATVVGRDPTTDIAVVKVSGVSGLTPVELGRSDDLRVGQPVVAIGSPFELAGTVTSGIVSSLNRPVSAGGNGDQTTVMSAVQTDAAINPGNSGGPLANMAGQVIGINSAIYSPKSSQGQGGESGGNVGIGFAIPIDQARRTADDIIKTGQATQTFIGARVQPAPTGGAQLGEITPGSPAEQAGLKSGDVVTKLDERAIPNADALVAEVRTRAPNEKVKFTLSDGKVIEVTLGGQPVTPN
ncbi:S1C family serine protease [Amycolatopsis pittospori]|uniref:S1C family serine protease n=1 Tax=Amycolatopsis pittospori TaxID=2749434 RepID=UPI0015F091B0|nr:trypsin-like peptidase domain-containing protein [Amycolatopsis pittospori]